MSLAMVPGTVTDANGEKRTALATYYDCGCPWFGVFQVSGQNHFHLQCQRCGTAYCPEGRCQEEEEAR